MCVWGGSAKSAESREDTRKRLLKRPHTRTPPTLLYRQTSQAAAVSRVLRETEIGVRHVRRGVAPHVLDTTRVVSKDDARSGEGGDFLSIPRYRFDSPRPTDVRFDTTRAEHNLDRTTRPLIHCQRRRLRVAMVELAPQQR